MANVGERVGALLSTTDTTVKLFGYGVYVGDVIPDGYPAPNPKIVLDDGNVVWGFECWWGAEAPFKAMIAGKTITLVDMAEYKKGRA